MYLAAAISPVELQSPRSPEGVERGCAVEAHGDDCCVLLCVVCALFRPSASSADSLANARWLLYRVCDPCYVYGEGGGGAGALWAASFRERGSLVELVFQMPDTRQQSSLIILVQLNRADSFRDAAEFRVKTPLF